MIKHTNNDKKIAICGATGLVGTELLKLLDLRNFPIKKLKLLASSRSAGKQIFFRGEKLIVEELSKSSFKNIDIAFFCAGAERSLEFVPSAISSGAIVIDNSSAFRMQEDVPLIVPEVNPDEIKKHNGLIANPNCSTIQLVVAINPLHKAFSIKRLIVNTYQAVSGTGKGAMLELEEQIKNYVDKETIIPEVYPYQIAFNVLPHIDTFQDNGYTKEEMKMVLETRKIMNEPELKVSATCVRVPVWRAHSEAVHIEFEKKLTLEKVYQILENAMGIKIWDAPELLHYPMPIEVAGTMQTWVGRIRKDLAFENGLALWVVADQLYKGAALNALQIAEML